ncbi:MAG: hypothetical protein L6422_05450 [Candidatus Marinimicrobia bacterium]|nr:hypothetical protein [bacterium]MCG2715719.1 hypothetical protein [Candidatus Neomarinimicrobiota bacterium]
MRNRIFYIFIMPVFLMIFIYRCGESIEDPDPPARPLWVEKSAPTDTIESGLRPYNDGNGILLEWHPNLEEDISGYKLYRTGEDIENKFALIADINAFKISGADTFFIDDLVQLNIDYFYYLKAYDQAENKSGASDTIRYRLIEKAEPLKPSGTVNNYTPEFEWHDFTNFTYEYVIRVESFLSREVIWISRIRRSNYTDFSQKISYNSDGSAALNSLESGTTYQWCIKSISLVDNRNFDIGGSISNWGYFIIE